jgi:polyhydroxyalkanoate synthesis regulator protein
MVPTIDPVSVKLYGNRRLYRPATGGYLTRDELIVLLRNGADVTVRDARTGADVTRLILSQRPTEH